MKIGILTFHCAHNYGAVLQCYALQETLKSMGHDVEVIDYRPGFLTYSRFLNTNKLKAGNILVRIKNLIGELLLLQKKNIRYYVYEHFIKSYLNLSDKIKKYQQIPSCYDIYIIGSDQVWNKKITKGYHNPYFGVFNFKKGTKKYISYAASMETDYLGEDDNVLRNLLSNFDAISVREKHLIDLLQPLTDKHISLVLDPTLIVDINIWHKIAIKPKIKNKYILIYQVKTNPNVFTVAKSIAEQTGSVIVNLFAWVDRFNKKYEYKCESPEKFLGWIKYAECIITTSFHGTAFSIIFEKNFYTLHVDSGNTRISSLLTNLGLGNRLVYNDEIPMYSQIDYDLSKEKLKCMKNDSMKFLYDNLK